MSSEIINKNFREVCEAINRELWNRGLPAKTTQELAAWGVTGTEDHTEILILVTEYQDFLNS